MTYRLWGGEAYNGSNWGSTILVNCSSAVDVTVDGAGYRCKDHIGLVQYFVLKLFCMEHDDPINIPFCNSLINNKLIAFSRNNI